MCRVIQYTEHVGLMTKNAAAPSSIAQMLQGYSIEVNPSDSKALDAAVDRLNPGTEVFLNWIPAANPMHMIGRAAKLRRAGLLAVPHVGARHLDSAAQLEELATRLAGDAGVDGVQQRKCDQAGELDQEVRPLVELPEQKP